MSAQVYSVAVDCGNWNARPKITMHIQLRLLDN